MSKSKFSFIVCISNSSFPYAYAWVNFSSPLPGILTKVSLAKDVSFKDLFNLSMVNCNFYTLKI